MPLSSLLKGSRCTAALAFLLILCGPALVQAEEGGSAASKVVRRPSNWDIKVPDIRAQHKADILVVQADFYNDGITDKHVYYRFRWLDADGNQVGDDEAWKQLQLLDHAQETVKGVGPSPKVADFKIELNVQRK